MTELESEEIRHQIYLEQYKTGQANKILKIIDDANNKIVKQLRRTNGVYTKKRYQEIKTFLSTLSREIRENIDISTDIDGIIDYELRKQKKMLNIGTKDINVDFIFPSVEQVKNSALFKPVTDTMTYQSYLNDIKNGFYSVWDSAVRTGYLASETTQDIVRAVMGYAPKLEKGVMATLRNSVYRNTRTVLQSFASATRMDVYKANSKYIHKLKFLATLDRRTCAVCGAMDGKLFDIDKAPDLPIHYNCRCILIPVIEGVENVSATRPMEGGVTEGTVIYSEWLSKQTPATQREILGSSRYKLYKKGYPIDRFIQGENILTLKQLLAKL